MNHNNKGFSLMELISAIAILSIVAIAAFTLLMFSINSNNMILAGASASQDAELLNKRLESLFVDEDKKVFIKVDNDTYEITFYSKNVSKSNSDARDYVPTGETLLLQDNSLYFGKTSSRELLQDNFFEYKVETIDKTNLIKISYSIGDHQFTKLFRVNFVPENDQQPQNTP